MKKNVVSIASIIFLLSCKKHTTENQPEPKTSYFPMNVGSTCVYRNYRIYETHFDSLKTEHDFGLDTVIVQKDSIINGNTYKKLTHSNFYLNVGPFKYYELLRDSSGYLVDERGEISFSPNFLESDTIKENNYFQDTELIYSFKNYMNNQLIDLAVPAGNFKTIAVIGFFSKGCPFPDAERTKHCYAPNVGLVLYEDKYMSSDIVNFRSKLVSYQLK